jgi:hypothetical protein
MRGKFEIVLAAFRGGETICDLFLAIAYRLLQRRPHELHREPDEDREPDRLAD